jgi:bifunctional UDP-N-acetylglucosamine pyrophosphorylase/glucosamine-1-phosphate N-acetyltransferase
MRALLNCNEKSAVIVSTYVEEPRGYGRIVVLENGTKIVEDKDCSEYERTICNVNCGIYAFSNRFLCDRLPTLNNQNAQREYYLTSIFDDVQDDVMLFVINKDKQHEVRGVNTKEELSLLTRLTVV